MGAPISSYSTAGIAPRISGALKPHHHDKVETPSVSKYAQIFQDVSSLQVFGQKCWGEGVRGHKKKINF
jgi:hypothetical protein